MVLGIGSIWVRQVRPARSGPGGVERDGGGVGDVERAEAAGEIDAHQLVDGGLGLFAQARALGAEHQRHGTVAQPLERLLDGAFRLAVETQHEIAHGLQRADGVGEVALGVAPRSKIREVGYK